MRTLKTNAIMASRYISILINHNPNYQAMGYGDWQFWIQIWGYESPYK